MTEQKGPKPITKGEVQALVEAAEEEARKNLVIRGYRDLYPIFDKFEHRQDCFQFLVKHGVLSEEQEKSFEQSWYKRINELKKEQFKKEQEAK